MPRKMVNLTEDNYDKLFLLNANMNKAIAMLIAERGVLKEALSKKNMMAEVKIDYDEIRQVVRKELEKLRGM